MDSAEHRRQLWRLRKRRQAERERAGRVVLHVEIEDSIGLVNLLVEANLLDDLSVETKPAVERALSAYLNSLVKASLGEL